MASWPALAALKPALSCNARLHEHCYRGERWTIIEDRAQGTCFRCPAAVGRLLRKLDGRTTLGEILEQRPRSATASAPDAASGGDAPPGDGCADRAAFTTLLAELLQAGLLQGELPVDHGAQLARWERQQRVQRRQRWLRPLMIKVPLWDPDRLLQRLAPRLRPLFTPAAAVAWGGVVALALMQCAQQWPALQWYWSARFLDPDNLVLLLLLYPLMKGLHELGHGVATRHWGGAVHETGIVLLVFMPLPYVDASASNAFPDKRQRMVVAGAGILVELLVAALGLLCWGQLDHGLARDVAFDLAVLGGFSSLLFNGNPLLRFDGYYVLADWLEIPNLGSRASRYLGYLWRRHALGLRQAASPVTAPGEATWFALYGVSAAVYQACITFGIALYLAGKYFVAGVLLAAWALLGRLLWPALGGLLRHCTEARQEGRLLRLGVVTTAPAAACLWALLVVPLNSSTRAEGIVMPAGDAYVRAGTDGFLLRVEVGNGATVRAGTALFRLDNPDLASELATVKAHHAELATRRAAALIADPLEAANLQTQLGQLQGEIDDLSRQIASLTVLSSSDGVFFADRPEDMPGRFYAKGDQLGWVLPEGATKATVALPASRAGALAKPPSRVEVRLHSQPGQPLEARLLQRQPAATNTLPHAALGSAGGGAIPVDASDGDRQRSIAPVFLYDIELAAGTGAVTGARLSVRFVHEGQPLAWHLGVHLRQLLQSRLKI